jgi:hypothetical protein
LSPNDEHMVITLYIRLKISPPQEFNSLKTYTNRHHINYENVRIIKVYTLYWHAVCATFKIKIKNLL